jgi:hypothetical protein
VEPFWDAVEETGLIASFHLVLEPAMLEGIDREQAAVSRTTGPTGTSGAGSNWRRRRARSSAARSG